MVTIEIIKTTYLLKATANKRYQLYGEIVDKQNFPTGIEYMTRSAPYNYNEIEIK